MYRKTRPKKKHERCVCALHTDIHKNGTYMYYNVYTHIHIQILSTDVRARTRASCAFNRVVAFHLLSSASKISALCILYDRERFRCFLLSAYSWIFFIEKQNLSFHRDVNCAMKSGHEARRFV